MFENLKTSIKSVLSDNGISLYDEYYDIDLIKNYNKSIGFLSVKKIEKLNDYQNFKSERNEIASEFFVTFECKVIAKKGMTSNLFSQTMNNVYADFMLSEDVKPVSLSIDNLKINSIYSRLESNIILKFKYYLYEMVTKN